MILDGSRRWAKHAKMPSVSEGHQAGAVKVREFLGWCDEIHIPMATLYLLSADNVSIRNPDELKALFDIIEKLCYDISRTKQWRVNHVGCAKELPASLVTVLEEASERTASNSGLHVNLAIGYGGREEIINAMRTIILNHQNNHGELETLANLLTPELLGQHLYTGGLPDPDLVIRTSGEQRLSDFMLWQSAYSEFYFVESLGPDLRYVDFLRALRDYTRRGRRFGS